MTIPLAKEVLDLLVVGQTSKQIAASLSIRPKTAMKHRCRVLEKLGVENPVLLVHLIQS